MLLHVTHLLQSSLLVAARPLIRRFVLLRRDVADRVALVAVEGQVLAGAGLGHDFLWLLGNGVGNDLVLHDLFACVQIYVMNIHQRLPLIVIQERSSQRKRLLRVNVHRAWWFHPIRRLIRPRGEDRRADSIARVIIIISMLLARPRICQLGWPLVEVLRHLVNRAVNSLLGAGGLLPLDVVVALLAHPLALLLLVGLLLQAVAALLGGQVEDAAPIFRRDYGFAAGGGASWAFQEVGELTGPSDLLGRELRLFGTQN